jgi:hypothetical protein
MGLQLINTAVRGGHTALCAPAEAANAAGGPQVSPGEIANWPMLQVVYRTDPDKLAALLPPGIQPGKNPHVHVTFYNFPIHDAPEYGAVVNVEADFDGIEGQYTLCMAIDQEDPIYISHELWGEPKYQAQIPYYRFGDRIEAKVIHNGHTYMEFSGKVAGVLPNLPEADKNEWWIKSLRATDPQPGAFDFPPHVVRVYSRAATAYLEKVEGQLTLRDSPWDPIATLLPIREQLYAQLWTPIFKDRKITLAGKLDPEKFWPYADTIGGSRWPGKNGAPPRHD